MLKEEILKKHKNEEHLLVSRFLDKIELAGKNKQIQCTDFLNMNEQAIVKNVINQTKEKAIFYGGYEEAERKILFVIPKNYNKVIKQMDYDRYIGAMRISLSNKIKEKYTHRNYLGALMKLGIKREKIGDILVDDDGADIIACKDIINFLYINLQSLKRFEKCTIQEINIKELKKIIAIPQYKTIQVSSMRLDNIISEISNTSRSKANQMILDKKVFINYLCESKVTKQIKEKDTITIRGIGRFKINQIIGNTRKGKINIKIEYF